MPPNADEAWPLRKGHGAETQGLEAEDRVGLPACPRSVVRGVRPWVPHDALWSLCYLEGVMLFLPASHGQLLGNP